MNESNMHNEAALTAAHYYSNLASHVGMWQLRDRLSGIVKNINEGISAPEKTNDAVFDFGPNDAKFEKIKINGNDYFVRVDCVNQVSTGVCLGFSVEILHKLINNDFESVCMFWDSNTNDETYHITEDGLYRGIKKSNM